MIVRNVCRLIEPPRQVRKEIQTLTLEQITTKLLPAIKEERFSTAIHLAFMTGLRRGELLGLRWQDVDFSAGILHVRQAMIRVKNHDAGRTYLAFHEPKTPQSRRSVPLTEASVTELKRHKIRQTEEKLLLGPGYANLDLVFCREDGKPVDPRTFHSHFTKAMQKADLAHMRPP